jgi:hypothetical protein
MCKFRSGKGGIALMPKFFLLWLRRSLESLETLDIYSNNQTSESFQRKFDYSFKNPNSQNFLNLLLGYYSGSFFPVDGNSTNDKIGGPGM